MASVLGWVVEAGRTPGQPSRCPHCQAEAGNALLRDEPRHLVTHCGAIAVTRQRAICRTCRYSGTLADGLAGVPARTKLSPVLHDWLVEPGVRTTCRDAITLLTNLTGLPVSPETVRTDAVAVGGRLLDEPLTAAATPAQTREPVGPVRSRAGAALGRSRWRRGSLSDRLARGQGWRDWRAGRRGARSGARARAPTAGRGGWPGRRRRSGAAACTSPPSCPASSPWQTTELSE
ncbi:MAG: hypothetical protein KatS3mg060_1686 [Dehalococcoidia bacterium]|nr:MAG: hypothetical protein KatS3mg060_1686 [Dehalococcoidia bacterium]